MSGWKTLVRDLGNGLGWLLASPAQKESIKEIEEDLSPFPEELASLLLETNGVQGGMNGTIVWDVKRIKEDNEFLRTEPDIQELYMSFDSLLFFGDNGGGDQFGIATTGTGTNIFAWDHENDSRLWIAGSLKDYLERAAKGDTKGPDWFKD